jgi:hypothetical protein
VSKALADARPTFPLAQGLRALALAQAGHDGEAMLFARRALSMDADLPHAQVVIADDHAQRGSTGAAVAFLESHLSRWRGRFWRNALLTRLARLKLLAGEVAGALDILDTELLPAAQTDAHALQRAIAFLWRMEIKDMDVGNRWREIGDMVQARWHEHILPLYDLHFVFALARDGREQAVRAFLASMERVGEADNSGHWQSLVIPLARGLALLAQGRDALAVSVVEPVLPRLTLLGGCRQDREVIRQMFDHATTRTRLAKVSARRPAEMQVWP